MFRSTVRAFSLCVWLAAEGFLFLHYSQLNQLVVLALVHLIGAGVLVAIYFRHRSRKQARARTTGDASHCETIADTAIIAANAEAEIQAMSDTLEPAFATGPVEEFSEAELNAAAAPRLEETEDESDILELPPIASMEEENAPAQSLSEASSRDCIAAAFIEKLQSIIAYDTCAVTLIMPENGDPLITHAAGEHASYLKGRTITLGEGVTGWAIANNRSFCNTDPKLDLPTALAVAFNAYRALTVFPIAEDGQVYGAVSLYSRKLVTYSSEQQKAMREAVAGFACALSNGSMDILEGIETGTDAQIAACFADGPTILDNSCVLHDAVLDFATT